MDNGIDWKPVAHAFLERFGLELSPEQAAVYWAEDRATVTGGGERGGKTFINHAKGMVYAISLALSNRWPEVLVWCVGQEYRDACASWESPDQLLYWIRGLGLFDPTHFSKPAARDEMWYTITRGGSWNGQIMRPIRFETVSGHDPRDIGRVEPLVIIGEELGKWTRELWDRCYGRLSANYGVARGFFSGSFESDQHMFAELWSQGQAPNTHGIRSFSMPSWANKVRYPGGRNDPAILDLAASMSADRFLERHGGVPAPAQDLVLPEFRTILHVRPVTYDPASGPVYLGIDPAKYVYAVLFVQPAAGEVHVLDSVYQHQTTHEQVIQEVIHNPLWRHINPERAGTIDIAGTAHPLGLLSATEAWSRDTGITLASKYFKLDDTVERLRSILLLNPKTQRPRLAIDPKCTGLIAELGGGPSPVPRGGRWRLKGRAPQAENCDALKALGYLLAWLFGTVRPESAPDSLIGTSWLPPGRPTRPGQSSFRYF